MEKGFRSDKNTVNLFTKGFFHEVWGVHHDRYCFGQRHLEERVPVESHK